MLHEACNLNGRCKVLPLLELDVPESLVDTQAFFAGVSFIPDERRGSLAGRE